MRCLALKIKLLRKNCCKVNIFHCALCSASGVIIELTGLHSKLTRAHPVEWHAPGIVIEVIEFF